MRDSVPSPRYSPVCNVLRQWKNSLIPTCITKAHKNIFIYVSSVIEFHFCSIKSIKKYIKSIRRYIKSIRRYIKSLGGILNH